MTARISQGEATAYLQAYQQVLHDILDTINVGNQPGVKMFDGDRQVYGLDKDGKFHDEVSGFAELFSNAKLNEDFCKLTKATEGEVIPSVANKRVEIEGRTVLATDAEGKVIVALSTKASQQMSSQNKSEELNNGQKERPNSPSASPPVWKDWKTPNDAISWAKTQMPKVPEEQLRSQFESLPPVDGKKAPAWVEHILKEKSPESTPKSTETKTQTRASKEAKTSQAKKKTLPKSTLKSGKTKSQSSNSLSEPLSVSPSVSPSASPASSPASPPVWKDWKTPNDAISWAKTQMPEVPKEQLRSQFESLPPVDGKKAPAWVEHILKEKSPESTPASPSASPSASQSASPSASPSDSPSTPPVWKDWKTPDDAISWAKTQMPEVSEKQLESQFESLDSINGKDKKAPAWVELILKEKSLESTPKLNEAESQTRAFLESKDSQTKEEVSPELTSKSKKPKSQTRSLKEKDSQTKEESSPEPAASKEVSPEPAASKSKKTKSQTRSSLKDKDSQTKKESPLEPAATKEVSPEPAASKSKKPKSQTRSSLKDKDSQTKKESSPEPAISKESSPEHAASKESLPSQTSVPLEAKDSQTVENPKEQEADSGTARIQKVLNQLPDGELKSFLQVQQQQVQEQLQEQTNQMKMMQQMLQEQQKEQVKMQQMLQQKSIPENQALLAIATRVEEPKQTRWWQKASVNPEEKETVVHIQRKQIEQQTANTLHEVYQRQVGAGATECQMEDYKITQEGKTHTLSDRSGESLLKWQEGAMGINVVPGSCKLKENHFTEIDQVQQQLTTGETLGGAFKLDIGERGASDSKYLQRVTNVVEALTGYAKNKGADVKVEGSVFYEWSATQSGKTEIYRKGEKEPILTKNGEEVQSKMTHDDLTYFEKITPALEQQQNVQKSPQSHTKTQSHTKGSKNSEISR